MAKLGQRDRISHARLIAAAFFDQGRRQILGPNIGVRTKKRQRVSPRQRNIITGGMRLEEFKTGVGRVLVIESLIQPEGVSPKQPRKDTVLADDLRPFVIVAGGNSHRETIGFFQMDVRLSTEGALAEGNINIAKI